MAALASPPSILGPPVELTVEGRPHPMKANIQYSFDREADILYLSRGDLSLEVESGEIGDNIIVHRDRTTDEVVGFTLLNFLKRAGEGRERVTLPVEASFKVAGV
jgi:uncharacterized protein YuzE